MDRAQQKRRNERVFSRVLSIAREEAAETVHWEMNNRMVCGKRRRRGERSTFMDRKAVTCEGCLATVDGDRSKLPVAF